MRQSRYRWFVVAIFFAFMLLHQADKLLISPTRLQHYDDVPKLVPALGANVMTILATDALLAVGYVLATVLGV